jgi:hypothetical protein
MNCELPHIRSHSATVHLHKAGTHAVQIQTRVKVMEKRTNRSGIGITIEPLSMLSWLCPVNLVGDGTSVRRGVADL